MEDSMTSTPTSTAKSWVDEGPAISTQQRNLRPIGPSRKAGVSQPEIVRNPAMVRITREIEAVAPLRSTVLITGETGTGKGVTARRIHRLSNRRDRPFVQVDCAALPANLIESELFGHERGAFTGAVDRRAGLFEGAENGTVFLDEIGELPLTLQSKLLHVLQDRTFTRVGGTRSHRMSARVIAATNRNLFSEVRRGRFRQDLLYRIDVFRVELPPLRERVDDISALIDQGLETIASELRLRPPTLSRTVRNALERHTWPGNLRELMNVLERLVVRHAANLLDDFAVDQLFSTATQIPDSPRPPHALHSPPTGPLPDPGSDAERHLLAAALTECGGNVARVARRLGIARSTLRYRLALHNLKYLIPND